MSKKRKAVIAGNDISNMHTFFLGGYEQKILIEAVLLLRFQKGKENAIM